MTDDLSVVPCPQCGHPAKEVVHAEVNLRHGWYCPHCILLINAIARERKWQPQKNPPGESR